MIDADIANSPAWALPVAPAITPRTVRQDCVAARASSIRPTMVGGICDPIPRRQHPHRGQKPAATPAFLLLLCPRTRIGKGNDHAKAGLWHVLQCHRAFEPVDNALDDRESEAGSLPGRQASANERFEYPFEIRRRNAEAGVFDLQ